MQLVRPVSVRHFPLAAVSFAAVLIVAMLLAGLRIGDGV